ncbi:MAG: RIP metalloprotease RseP [Candidatus Mcinerneyibacterium aminivorans]|uniref:Zinc metalloprotease n=1 Tax=Candidatus Mcinerneyibacterium aminivorans TaxID=2703815 RepID=A0A5D0MI12_9BACT|nr:MAG: RIP metalloprotease RseP [Candidatus Mcinerneyibacterium aminivorans]
MLLNIILALFILGIVVFIHELGHFIFAKKVGIKVYTFSIGFGPKLFGINYKGTLYKISMIPFGGYVSMAGEDPNDRTGSPEEYSSKTVWQRFQVAIAGPVLNFILAFILFWIILIIGIEEPKQSDKPMEIHVVKDSIAAKIGMETGDELISIDNKKVSYWQEFQRNISLSGSKVNIKWNDVSAEKIKNNTVKIERDEYTGGADINKIGILPQIEPVIAGISKNSPANTIGLKKNDRIISINNKNVEYTYQLNKIIGQLENPDISLKISRNGNVIEKNVELAQRQQQEGYYLGVIFETVETEIVKYPFFKAFSEAINRFIGWIGKMFNMLKMLFSGAVSVKTVSGPVGIVKVTAVFATLGIVPLFQFLAIISMNLGIVNLIPIPITDGGHILFLGIEKLRGKPLKPKTLNIIMQISALLLVGLALFITYNDIIKIFKGVL